MGIRIERVPDKFAVNLIIEEGPMKVEYFMVYQEMFNLQCHMEEVQFQMINEGYNGDPNPRAEPKL